jgi:hypothetical protein
MACGIAVPADRRFDPPSNEALEVAGGVGARARVFSYLNGEGVQSAHSRKIAMTNELALCRSGDVSRSGLDELDAGDAAMAPHQARATDGSEAVERKIKRDAELRCERADIEARALVAQVEDIAGQQPRVVCRQDARRNIDLRPLD